jgi:hypothetical protein
LSNISDRSRQRAIALAHLGRRNICIDVVVMRAASHVARAKEWAGAGARAAPPQLLQHGKRGRAERP